MQCVWGLKTWQARQTSRRALQVQVLQCGRNEVAGGDYAEVVERGGSGDGGSWQGCCWHFRSPTRSDDDHRTLPRLRNNSHRPP